LEEGAVQEEKKPQDDQTQGFPKGKSFRAKVEEFVARVEPKEKTVEDLLMEELTQGEKDFEASMKRHEEWLIRADKDLEEIRRNNDELDGLVAELETLCRERGIKV